MRNYTISNTEFADGLGPSDVDVIYINNTHMCVSAKYIKIYIERETERDRDKNWGR